MIWSNMHLKKTWRPLCGNTGVGVKCKKITKEDVEVVQVGNNDDLLLGITCAGEKRQVD